MSELVAYVDGGSLGNPGPSGIGVVIDGCESGPIRISKWIGHQDNNVAEYVARVPIALKRRSRRPGRDPARSRLTANFCNCNWSLARRALGVKMPNRYPARSRTAVLASRFASALSSRGT